MPTKDDSAATKADLAAAARAARRAAQEAEALRINLYRRKQQARARATPLPRTRPDAGAAAKPAGKLNQAAEGIAAHPDAEAQPVEDISKCR